LDTRARREIKKEKEMESPDSPFCKGPLERNKKKPSAIKEE